MVVWATDVYPELSGSESIIYSSRAFSDTVRQLRNNYDARKPDSLIMPVGYTNRKQVVDLFSRDVAKLLKEHNEQQWYF